FWVYCYEASGFKLPTGNPSDSTLANFNLGSFGGSGTVYSWTEVVHGPSGQVWRGRNDATSLNNGTWKRGKFNAYEINHIPITVPFLALVRKLVGQEYYVFEYPIPRPSQRYQVLSANGIRGSVQW